MSALGKVGMEQSDKAAVAADHRVQRHSDRLSLAGRSCSTAQAEQVFVLSDRPLNVEAARLAPPDEPFRFELRLGILRIRCHARILQDRARRKYVVTGERHEPSEHASLSDAKAAAEASLDNR